MCCSMLQCVAVCCSVLWYVYEHSGFRILLLSIEEASREKILEVCVAACCSMLQCVAVCCSLLWYVYEHSGLRIVLLSIKVASRE